MQGHKNPLEKGSPKNLSNPAAARRVGEQTT